MGGRIMPMKGVGLLFCLLAAWAFWAAPLLAKPLADQGGAPPARPAYARLYDQALKLQKRGDWAGALKTISRVYSREVPVDAFYRALEQKKTEILSGLEEGARLSFGVEAYTLGSLKSYFRDLLLPQTEYLRHDPGRAGELPLARYYYLAAVVGKPHSAAAPGGLLQWACPALDVDRALNSHDPWLVSGALFLARKGAAKLSAQAVIDRWERRPDMWDQVTTAQALIFLARLSPSGLAGLKVSNQDIAAHLADLKPVSEKGACKVRVRAFWLGSLGLGSTDYLRPMGCRGLQIKGLEKGGRAEKWAGLDQGRCSESGLMIPPGRYALKHLSRRAHGKSRVFSCRTGVLTTVVMTIYPHI